MRRVASKWIPLLACVWALQVYAFSPGLLATRGIRLARVHSKVRHPLACQPSPLSQSSPDRQLQNSPSQRGGIRQAASRLAEWLAGLLHWLRRTLGWQENVRPVDSPTLVAEEITERSSEIINVPATTVEDLPEEERLVHARRYAEERLRVLREVRKLAGQSQPNASYPLQFFKPLVDWPQDEARRLLRGVRTLADLSDDDLLGKRVLVRCDVDALLDQEDSPLAAHRLRATLSTLSYLTARGAKVLVASHFGHPNGTGYEAAFSLRRLAPYLESALSTPIRFVPDCIGLSVAAAVSSMQPGQVALLENVGFYPRDAESDAWLSAQLATHTDVFVQDAFSRLHTDTSSTSGVARHVNTSVVGWAVVQEWMAWQHALTASTWPSPVALVLGECPPEGAEAPVEDQQGLLAAWRERVDVVVLGARLSAAWRAAASSESVPSPHTALVRQVKDLVAARAVRVVLAEDVVLEASRGDLHCVSMDTLPVDRPVHGVAWGPATCSHVLQALASCGTIVWHGSAGDLPSPSPMRAGSLRRLVDGLAHTPRPGGVLLRGRDAEALVRQAGGGGGGLAGLGDAVWEMVRGRETWPGLLPAAEPAVEKAKPGREREKKRGETRAAI